MERHFGFLDAFGFRSFGAEERSQWETSVVYKARQVALKICLSREVNRAEVNLIRLVDGEVPPYPIWITDEVLNWTLLDNVIEARRPDLSAPSGGLKDDDLERQLATSCVLSANSATRLTCIVAGQSRRIDRTPTFRFNV